jgi:hypothetical protein
MKHVKPVSKRPSAALDVSGLPFDITFLIDMMDAFITKKTALNT